MASSAPSAPSWRRCLVVGTVLLSAGALLTLVETATGATVPPGLGPGAAVGGLVVLLTAFGFWQARPRSGRGDQGMASRERVLSELLTAAHGVRRVWWRLRRPRTFGVKVLLLHPEDPDRLLAVRHSYVDHERWALPGGRCRPSRESPESAARREVREELDLEIAGELHVLTTDTSTAEGKRDTITVLEGTAATAAVRTSVELLDARWTRTDLSDLPPGDPVSRWLRTALSAR